MILRVSTKTGATLRVHGMMYKSVAQLLLLYGSKSWVVMGVMLKVLEDFHPLADIQITGMTVKRSADGEWEYYPVVVALESVGLHPIQE